MRYSPLLTDLYELTMMAAYLEEGLENQPAVFDLFFRGAPFQGGYTVFAGLDPALEYLESISFNQAELDYLTGLGLFKSSFIEYLRGFRFTGQVTAAAEGTVVFANEPLLTVKGPLAQAQFVETALLNIINFQTLVATKAARINRAAQGGPVLEFGLRRAQGPNGALSCARAAYVGGCRRTSNVLAGMEFGIPVQGTQAHSFIMAFPDELSAFRAYAAAFPDNCTLLVDTYDTLGSGLPHAITVARELRAAGHELRGVRIDSGDLAFLSREARRLLDQAGLSQVKLVASSDLDEYAIAALRAAGSEFDIYGVGTRLATCAGPDGGALNGVYKLVEIDGSPRLKMTNDRDKATLPGAKRLLRSLGPDGTFRGDVIGLEGEEIVSGQMLYDPVDPGRGGTTWSGAVFQDLRVVVMADGRRVDRPRESLDDLADRAADQLARLPDEHARLVGPRKYEVRISQGLHGLRAKLATAAGSPE